MICPFFTWILERGTRCPLNLNICIELMVDCPCFWPSYHLTLKRGVSGTPDFQIQSTAPRLPSYQNFVIKNKHQHTICEFFKDFILSISYIFSKQKYKDKQWCLLCLPDPWNLPGTANSVDFKAPRELWNPMSTTVLIKCSLIWNKVPLNIWWPQSSKVTCTSDL